MKMRKILASVVAAAVATSAMAISAFAAVVKDINNDKTVYNATVTYNKAGTVVNGGDSIEFVAPSVTGSNVTGLEVTVSVVAGGKIETKTKSSDGSKIVFTTNTGVSFTDFTNVSEGADWQATIVVKISNNNEDYTADDEFDIDGTKGKLVVNDNTSEAGAVTGYDFDVSEFTVTERAEIKAAEKVTLTLNLNKATETENGLVTLKKGEDTYAVKVVAKGTTSVTFDLAIADFYNADYDLFEDPEFKFEIKDAGEGTYAFTSAKLVFGEVEDDIEEPGEDDEDEGEEDEEGENPKTGVALAVLPAVIGGAATLIARKRK